jgi:hypothetical protein
MSYIEVTDANNQTINVYNPLADFKSYSYYHVLIMCDTTETAAALSDMTNPDDEAWMHPSFAYYTSNNINNDFEYLGKYAPKYVKNAPVKDDKGQITSYTVDPNKRYCVLINGSTDAAMVITRVNYQTHAAISAVNNDRFTSLAAEGTIEISEPRGISFLDTIAQCCVALGKDSGTVTYLLKTFFVGYDHNDEIQTYSHIRPLTCIVTSASGSFTEAGGSYTLQFVSMFNGASRLPQYDKMVNSLPSNAKTLRESIEMIQQHVNERYNKLYDCVKRQVEKAETELGYESGFLSKTLKRVKYVVKLDPFYHNYMNSTVAQQNSDTGKCEGEANPTTTGTDYSLESALQQIMQRCAAVNEDITKGIKTDLTINGKRLKAGTKVEYKIHTSLCTTPTTGQEASDPYVVTYTIRPYPAPKQMLSVDDEEVRETVIKPNTINFDYVYTGKNVDILEFDMNVNAGLAYLQIATLTNSYKTQGELLPAVVTMPDVNYVVQMQQRMKSKDNQHVPVDIPVFFSTNMELPINRTTDKPFDTAQMAYNLTKHSSFEVLGVSMKVTGNLLLLDSATSLGGCDATQENTESQPGRMDWGVLPGYAKVNIMMPRNNDDIGLFGGRYDTLYNTSADESAYAAPFWFQGYYYILGIDHIFDDGEFVQNLQMIGMPQQQTMESINSTTKQQFSVDVESCFGNTTKCPDNSTQTTTNQQRTVQSSPAHQAVQTAQHPQMPTSEADKYLSTIEPEQVKGWDKASPEVQQAIRDAAASSDPQISAGTLALVAAYESEFKPTVWTKNRGKTEDVNDARGLYQFIGTTWASTPTGKANPITSTHDPRTNPELSAKAAVELANRNGYTTPSQIYMAHNLGDGAAREIIKESAAGNCALTMTELYKRHPKWGSWATVAAANRFDVNATVCSIQESFAGRLASRVKDVNMQLQSGTQAPLQAGQAAAKQTPTQPLPQTKKPATAGDTVAAQTKCSPTQQSIAEPGTCGEAKQPTIKDKMG